MRGVYKGVECYTDDYRIDGVWHKALIYQTKDDGDDEKALTAAGFTDMENDLWVRALTTEEYRSITEEFEKQQQAAEQQQLRQNREDNEQSIELNARLHAYNEHMGKCRVKMRALSIRFVGASVFSWIISIVLIYSSIINSTDSEMRKLALPLWASLSFLPIVIVLSLIAAVKKIPEMYIAIAGLMAASAVVLWNTASIALGIITAAFAAFYFMTRPINLLKTDPAYPVFFDKSDSDLSEQYISENKK